MDTNTPPTPTGNEPPKMPANYAELPMKEKQKNPAPKHLRKRKRTGRPKGRPRGSKNKIKRVRRKGAPDEKMAPKKIRKRKAKKKESESKPKKTKRRKQRSCIWDNLGIRTSGTGSEASTVLIEGENSKSTPNTSVQSTRPSNEQPFTMLYIQPGALPFALEANTQVNLNSPSTTNASSCSASTDVPSPVLNPSASVVSQVPSGELGGVSVVSAAPVQANTAPHGPEQEQSSSSGEKSNEPPSSTSEAKWDTTTLFVKSGTPSSRPKSVELPAVTRSSSSPELSPVATSDSMSLQKHPGATVTSMSSQEKSLSSSLFSMSLKDDPAANSSASSSTSPSPSLSDEPKFDAPSNSPSSGSTEESTWASPTVLCATSEVSMAASSASVPDGTRQLGDTQTKSPETQPPIQSNSALGDRDRSDGSPTQSTMPNAPTAAPTGVQEQSSMTLGAQQPPSVSTTASEMTTTAPVVQKTSPSVGTDAQVSPPAAPSDISTQPIASSDVPEQTSPPPASPAPSMTNVPNFGANSLSSESTSERGTSPSTSQSSIGSPLSVTGGQETSPTASSGAPGQSTTSTTGSADSGQAPTGENGSPPPKEQSPPSKPSGTGEREKL